MNPDDLTTMIDAGELERVEPDQASVSVELEDAKTHRRSAEKLVDDDPILAYSAVYFEHLDEMRVVRNDAEYSGRRIGRQEVAADLETARSLVRTVEAELERLS